MNIREATLADANGMSKVLEEIFQAGLRASAGDEQFVQEWYLDDQDRIRCSIAESAEGRILGFQSLKVVHETNIYNAPAGWGVIGTHIAPSAARQGIGRQLFAISVWAARQAGLEWIEAQIGDRNTNALAFYEAMGFRTYRFEGSNVCKSFRVDADV